MAILQKGPGEPNYPTGKPRKLKNNNEGERTFIAEGGVQDDEIVERTKPEVAYTPTPLQNIGDDGRG